MSETVREIGRIRRVDKLENETLDQLCERLSRKHGFNELESYHDNWIELVLDEMYRKYVVYENDLYEVEELDYEDNEYEFFRANKNDDGSINFHLMYYNGGCSFNEAIEYALDEME